MIIMDYWAVGLLIPSGGSAMKKSVIIGLLFSTLFLFDFETVKPWKEPSQEFKEKLMGYLKSHWLSPEDYVISKFGDHDLVFLGEYHRIKHDVELVHHLIPRLYAAGIRNLGIEFGCYEYQDKVDRLITAPEYDENLARWLMFKEFVVWGFIEYMDIYRKAWELNKSLPPDKPKFRVVNLSYRPNWSAMEKKMTPELWKKVWFKGDGDAHMAGVIIKEFVNRNMKALIYSGSHHAFTRYHQPVVDFEKKEFIRFNTSRMGNLVFEKIADKAFNIFLHSPWSIKADFNEHNYPVGGVIDSVMDGFTDMRVGFDVKGSPFAGLKDMETYYAYGYDPFELGMFCDGYIYQMHFHDYEGCTVDEKFITAENFEEAVQNIPNFAFRKHVKKPEDLIKVMKDDANMKSRFRDLK
jgi:hypothetical protein